MRTWLHKELHNLKLVIKQFCPAHTTKQRAPRQLRRDCTNASCTKTQGHSWVRKNYAFRLITEFFKRVHVTCHVCCCMSIVLVHEGSSISVQPRHWVHCPSIGLSHLLLGHDALDLLPPFRFVQPLMCVDGYLSPQRFCQDKDITGDSPVWPEKNTLFRCQPFLGNQSSISERGAFHMRSACFRLNEHNETREKNTVISKVSHSVLQQLRAQSIPHWKICPLQHK